MPSQAPPHQYPDLSMRRILDFLKCEGVECNKLPVHVPSVEDCVELMDSIKSRAPSETATRKAHDERHRKILRHSSKHNNNTKCRWLNKHHEQLTKSMELGTPSSTLQAVFGDPKKASSGSYQLDFDEGYVLCPSPFQTR